MPDLISVKDRMPEFGEEVVIYWDSQYKDIAEYKMGLVSPKWISQHYGQIDLTSVTHWMPLPNLEPKEPPEQTNADRIRAMSDEELANWLEYEGGGACAEVCGWLDWLRQPAEED